MTDLDALDPGMIYYILYLVPELGIRLKHFTHKWSTGPWVQVIDSSWAGRNGGIGVRTRRGVSLVKRISGELRSSPRNFREVETVIYNPASPDIDQSSIVGFINESDNSTKKK